MHTSITIRPWKQEDAAPLASICNNKKIWQNLRDKFPHPYMLGNALEWIAYNRNVHPAQNLAIVYNGIIAGSIGLVPKTDVSRKNIELGYFIGEPYWGKGIATEAVATILPYIQKHFDVVRVYAEVFETNTASMRVLEKNGFHRESTRQKAVFKSGVLMNDCVWVKFLA